MNPLSTMILHIKPATSLNGHATTPGSKSHTVRALLIASLAEGASYLYNVLDAEDSRAAFEVFKDLGADITYKINGSGGLDVIVHGLGVPLTVPATELYSSNSGITTTFTIPLIGLRKNADIQLTLSCGEQMRKRPLAGIISAVKSLGMEVVSFDHNNHCPLGLSGELTGGYCTVDGTNSQYLSALLLSLPCAQKDSLIRVKNLQERPYVDMTLSWLDEQHIRYGHFKKEEGGQTVDTFKIFGNQSYTPFTKIIPGDFTAASYLIAAAVLLNSEVTLHGLNMEDSQGDKRLIPILQQMGANIEIEKTARENVIRIFGGKYLQGAEIDCGDIPDLVPTLAVIGTQARGKTTLLNGAGARLKETDRLKSMAAGLTKMGAKIEETESSLIIYQSKLHAAKLRGCNDHRTVMALAVAGLVASTPGSGEGSGNDETTIDTAESINKTFSNFTGMMNSLGAKMEIKDEAQKH
jgi:3-phosphoshikimate 1-carboxyvinyltransferase